MEPSNGEGCHIDHFFTWRLCLRLPDTDLNGVWNLLLACAACNGEKFDAIPDLLYF